MLWAVRASRRHPAPAPPLRRRSRSRYHEPSRACLSVQPDPTRTEQITGSSLGEVRIVTAFTEKAPMHHVSIGFLHQGFHLLYRFLNLSNRQECPVSKLDHVLKAGAILRHSVPRQDRQFRFLSII